MKSFLLLVTALTAMHAQAGTISLDLRTDMDGTTYNDAATAAGVGANNYRFYMQTGRLDYKGSLDADTSFRFRARFNRDQGVVANRDALNTVIDYANVMHKFSDSFGLTVGKFLGDGNGNEGPTPGGDQYYFTESYLGGTLGKLTGAPITGLVPSKNVLKGNSNTTTYVTGAKASYFINENHTVNLMVLDLDADTGRGATTGNGQDVGAVSSQNKSMLGASYQGYMLDKTFSVLASYHAQTINADVNANYAAVGLGYTMGPVLVQADYSANTFNSKDALGTPKDQLNSATLKAVYTIDPNYSVQAKVTSSQEKFDNSVAFVNGASNNYLDYAAALEWKPKANDIFRYHAAYVSRTETPDSGDSRTSTEVIVGMRILADFIK